MPSDDKLWEGKCPLTELDKAIFLGIAPLGIVVDPFESV